MLSVSWASDGKRIVSSHEDGKILEWDWSLERFNRLACDFVWRELDDDEWKKWIKPFVEGADNRTVCDMKPDP